MQWATGTTSDSAIVTRSAVSARQKAVKKLTEKLRQIATQSAQSLEAQEYIAGQYPPVDENVSSTVRLGRSLVSGALGKKIDDPKMLETVVLITDCNVVLQSTRKKAKVPVSAPPPNSIDSDVEADESSDPQLSQSATDIGVQIELPGRETEVTPRGKKWVRSRRI